MPISTTTLRASIASLVLLAGLAATSPARGEEIDNPQYLSWSKFKPGSTRTLVGEMSAQGMQMQMEMVSTLKNLTAEEATISTQANVVMAGQTRAQPERQRPVKAKVEKRDVELVGEEDVEAGGKTYKCAIYEVHVESPMSQRGNTPTTQPADGSKSRIWVSPEVPGGIVKMLVRTPVGDMTMLLKSFEAK